MKAFPLSTTNRDTHGGPAPSLWHSVKQVVFGPSLQTPADLWLFAVAMAALAVGVASRFWDLGYPPRMTFDEEHFVVNARHYIAGMADNNDHPPLGKLLIAVGFLMLDDHSLGWRIVPLAFGLQSIALSYYLGKLLFNDARAGLLAAVFISIDGFFISYSRTALLDGMLVCLMLWSALTTVLARSWKDIAIASVLIGLATTVKWSGVVMVVPLILWVAVLHRYPWRWLLLLALVPAVHLSLWSFALWISNEPNSVRDVIAVMRNLLSGHLRRETVTHPELSRWYTWPILYHPITLQVQHEGMRVRMMSTIGSPFLWWSVTLAVFATACASALRLVPASRRFLDERVWGTADEKALSFKAVVFALACWVSPLLPWILTKRDSYMYHYLPSYAFGLVLLAGVFAWIFQRWRVFAWVLVLTACIVSIYFIPVSSKIPLTHRQLDRRLVFDEWRQN